MINFASLCKLRNLGISLALVQRTGGEEKLAGGEVNYCRQKRKHFPYITSYFPFVIGGLQEKR